ncbi:hypothetical protein MHM98_05460 [Psychrobium sp. MM17-31]|uniref:hypothetical protein n=1 Tax=Psychrobium sp. MM17-31 TaxID=2917758 RepID=UPI001EF647D6|nr:hypothetical protein [Psychrobium sp. MM17-31]MCG7530804.1 hypothetical protein [Psychrobium sp. MM17-31]
MDSANKTPTSNSTQPARFTQRLDNRELTKTSFWISQIFMIIATITGVYLAAQEGLSQAIQFDSLNRQENNYHLRRSLDNEITANIATLKEYADLVASNKVYDLKSQRPVLLKFVWENMKFSSSTLETPSDILSQASHFYAQSDDIIRRIENRKYGATFGSKKLRELINEMENNGLKALRANHQQLAAKLAQSGIVVN